MSILCTYFKMPEITLFILEGLNTFIFCRDSWSRLIMVVAIILRILNLSYDGLVKNQRMIKLKKKLKKLNKYLLSIWKLPVFKLE